MPALITSAAPITSTIPAQFHRKAQARLLDGHPTRSADSGGPSKIANNANDSIVRAINTSESSKCAGLQARISDMVANNRRSPILKAMCVEAYLRGFHITIMGIASAIRSILSICVNAVGSCGDNINKKANIARMKNIQQTSGRFNGLLYWDTLSSIFITTHSLFQETPSKQRAHRDAGLSTELVKN